MATKAEVLRLLRFRDQLTTRDVETILDYVDQEVGVAIGGHDNLGNHIAEQDLDMAGFDIITPDTTGSAENITIEPGRSSTLRGGSLSLNGGDSNGAGAVEGGSVGGQGGNSTGNNRRGGNVSWTGGVGLDGPGGNVTLQGGLGQGNFDGGLVSVTGGQGSSGGGGGEGGPASLVGGPGGVAEAGGAAIVTGGQGANGGGTGGAINITSGAGGSISGISGDVGILTGTTTDGNTGSITIQTANPTGTNRLSGGIQILCGVANGTGAGSDAELRAGDAGATSGDGGDVILRPGGESNGLRGLIRTFRGSFGEGVVNNGTISPGGGTFTVEPNVTGWTRFTWGNAATGTVDIGVLRAGGTENGVLHTIHLTNGGEGTLTWGTMVEWEGGVPPVLTVLGVDLFRFYTIDEGTTWLGEVVGLDFS